MSSDQLEIDLDAVRSAEGELPLDELFGVLANAHARYTLYFLSDRQTATLEELTDAVTGFEAAATDRLAISTDHDRVRIQLHHVVLPKLDTLGYLEFDVETLTVARTNSPKLNAILERGD
ncbi:hypothetical protein OB905_04515 [Halobacteria archaeon AArc-dxtr1]|nr:hypothetical protein [Halobacteria archaeon AArc-dxtr1]